MRLFVLAAACSPSSGAGTQSGVPAAEVTQAQLEAEFSETARGAIPLAEAVAGDTAAFLARVQPFGPLDLAVLKARSSRHASDLRGFFLGVVGGGAGIDPAGLTERWHCGPPCALARRDTLVGRLDATRALVDRFRGMPRVNVVAAWPAGGYRVGTLTYDGRTFQTHTASPLMGFLPWRSAAVDSAVASAFAALGTDRAAVEALVAGLRAAGLAALARDPAGSVRAVLAGGIGDNEAGLLFLAPDASAPAPDGELPDGRTYVGTERVAPGVYFYVTT